MDMDQHQLELTSGQRFGFGANWQKFVSTLTEEQYLRASKSLLDKLGFTNLSGRRFLDIGSGSGLSSLVAYRAGADVVSFDFDPKSVQCTRELKRRVDAPDARWQVLQGSVLDRDFLEGLGLFDIVYSWGVLHHTGSMWQAIDNVAHMVSPHGKLFIAIYNDQGWLSRYWSGVKKLYNRSRFGAVSMVALHAPYFLLARVGGGLTRRWRGRPRDDRGMDFWRDIIDWLGGYPFEVARPEDVRARLEGRGFKLERLYAVGRRLGCNQFLFHQSS